MNDVGNDIKRVRNDVWDVAYVALNTISTPINYTHARDVTTDAAYNDTYESTRNAVREGIYEAIRYEWLINHK